MNVRGIRWIGVGTPNVRQMRSFAIDVLGMRVAGQDTPEFSELEMGDGAKLELFGSAAVADGPWMFASNPVVAGFLPTCRLAITTIYLGWEYAIASTGGARRRARHHDAVREIIVTVGGSYGRKMIDDLAARLEDAHRRSFLNRLTIQELVS